ncbi:gliding motility-associated C-terminal domain-containing protein [Fulvivirgaceae bacterium BMA10]|uniref:Gliding motility-associated C-terminal domain-containing protein n=1 Tax=Splendidivirga corallicola TaxID=3051826 RepID=A0ABT8KQJ9_9BACT|nr:gliding motility-associated C-terminal domain-containing protein [Fulvivirgaceae bacterium BMA10]
MRKTKLILIFLLLISAKGFTQEICDDGIDNDGDGFIDCFDADCASVSPCDETYTGNDVFCQAAPVLFPTFSMSQDWVSPNLTTTHFGRIAVGDLEDDGIPEVVTYNTYDPNIYVLNGDDGTIKYQRDVSGTFTSYWKSDVAIANIDGDNCAEIFAFNINSSWSAYRLVAYDCQLNELWSVDVGSRSLGTLSLVDFDGDGLVELYYKNEIRDAHTGTRLVQGTGNWNNINGGPVAVDMDGDGDLEIVSGGTIYEVNLGARTADGGSLTVSSTMPGYFVKNDLSTTSVADYNKDGNLDVIATGSAGSIGGTTTVFYWDVTNNQVRTYTDPLNNWWRGTGRLNIADLDGDGNMDVSYVSGEYLYALDENFNLLWRVVINEQSSGYTGCTLFDFNGDGTSEVVYRDERWLYIINGADGSIYPGGTVPCISRTAIEYPIVADVDGDGATELCVPCGTDDALAWANFNDLNYSINSQVRVFRSTNEPWVPARRVWNQHAYFNVNINDDLSVPVQQQQHHLVFSTGSCTSGPNTPLNGFLNQSPFLDSNGCPTYASPDLSFVGNSLSVNTPTCPDTDFTISFQVQNLGDMSLSGDLPITFYEGDPTTPTALKLNTEIITISNLPINGVLNVNNLTVNGNGSNFVLYIALNDAGTSVPISLPNTNFVECDYDNNLLSAQVDPLPFNLSAELVADNAICNVTSQSSGAVRAFVLVGGSEETADYTFNWFNGTTVTATPDFVGPIYANIPGGTYTVYATHNTASCNSDTVQITVADVVRTLSAQVILQTSFSNCKNPNGHLKSEVNGGDPIGWFEYEWYQGNDILTSPLIGVSHEITGLSPGEYTLLVREKSSGCETTASYTILDESTSPAVTASATNVDCLDPNSGTVSANVGGSTGGFTFEWYIGNSVKPTADYTGADQTGLPVGDYTVVATRNSSGCSSTPVIVTISQIPDPVVNASILADQTSCDPASPNGQLSADVGGATAGFTFTWYQGQGTGGAVVGNAATATGLSAGTYTVEAVDNVTGCSDTEEITLNDNFTYPTVTANVDIHLSICSPGSSNGQVSANVGGTTAGYSFLWFDGNVGTPDLNNPDFTGAVYTGLTAGEYTVVAVTSSTSCPSTPAVVEVLNNTVAPTINVANTDQTSCDPLNPNGQLSADVGGGTAGFTFTWFQGQGTGGAVISNTATASNLAAGIYTVRAVNDATGCENTSEITLNNNFTYPTVSTSIDNHLTICNPAGFNGQVSANVGGTTAGYTFLWFDGNIGTPDLNNPDFTGVTYTGLGDGFYTVVAVDNTTACPSTPVSIEVLDNTVTPTISVVNTSQTSCDPLNPNGELSANIGGTTVGYTFTWFQGQGTGGAVISNTASASNLAAGVYTVRAVNDATGCENTLEATVVNNFTYPVAAPVVDNHLTICDPANYDGQVSAAVGGVTAGYTFLWFDGNIGTPDLNNPDFTGATYTGLGDGFYTVVAVDNNTSCPSNPAAIEILDNTVNPAITTVTDNDQTSCDPLAPNGQLSANVGGTTIGYTFTWFQGQGTGGAVVSNTATANNLAAGVYTVRAVNDLTACESTAEVTLNNNFTYPVATPAVDNHLTICDPANYNGQVSAAVGGVTAGYTFLWFDGNVGTPDLNNPDFTGVTYTGLGDGFYTVVAVDNNTSCPSNPAAIEILDNTVNPVITTVTDNDQTSCDPLAPNGQLSANVGGVTAGYTFTWFQGQGTGGAVVSNTPTANNLAAGVYTVRAVDDLTACENTAEVTLNNNFTYPVATPAVDNHLTICDPANYNGQVSAAVGGVTAGYTFLWFDGNVGTPDLNNPDFTGITYSGLGDGFYTVVAVDNNTSCPSNPAAIEILDNTVNPVITTVVDSDQTSCDPLTPNGQLSANVGGVTAGYTFTWFQGQGTGGAVVSNTPTANNLAAGVYTVRAVDDLTACENTAEVTLNNNFTYPVATPAVDNHLTICDPANYNGQVSAAVGGVTAGYTFLWFDGNVGTPDLNNPDFTGITYSGLGDGFYTVVAVDNNTSCPSNPAAIEILDNTVNPVITTVVDNDQTSCDPLTPNGQLSANVGGVTAGYTFTWFQGQGTGGAVVSNTPIANGLAAGVYTVRAVDDVTACESTAEVTLNNNFTYPVATPAVDNHSTICDPANYNGQVSAAVGGVTAGYTFLWFDGNVGTPDLNNPDFTGITYSGLGDGFYTVVAVDNNTSCPSNPAVIEILDNTINPTITTVTLNDQTSCDPLNPNGQLSANVGGTTVGYTFTWFQGQGTSGAVVSNTATANNLAAGVYTVRAVNDLTACESTAEVTLNNNFTYPVATPAVDNHLTICDPANYNGQVSAAVGGVTAGYTFLWFDGNIGTPDLNNPDFTGVTYTGLGDGFYTVVAVDNNTSCPSNPAVIEILDNTVNPTITTVTLNDQTSCDPLNPNGQLTANVGGTTVGYTFTWFQGQGTGGAVVSNTATANNLAAGTYTVRAVNDATACENTAEVTLNNNFTYPVAVPTMLQPQSFCVNPNGQVNATVGGTTTGYTFYWFDGNIGTPDINNPDFTGPTYINLAAGDYTVVAVDNSTSCASNPAVVTVNDITVNPVLTTGKTDNTACDPLLSNGTISANVGGATAGYTFHVYAGQNTIPANEVAGSPSPNVGNLAIGIYTVEVIDNTTGCSSTGEVTIDNNIVLPTITATPNNIMNCSPDDGSVSVSVSIGAATDYTFSWYDGSSIKPIPDYAETSNVLSNLTPGTYTVTAFNNVLGCGITAPQTVTVIKDPSTVVTVAEDITSRVTPADCNAGTGELYVNASSPGNVGGFSYVWYSGDKNMGMSPLVPAVATSNATGLLSGRYTVIVSDNDTGCQDSLSISLPFLDEHTFLNITATDVDHCTVPNGEMDITIQPSPGALGLGADQTWYRLDIYLQGAATSPLISVPGTNPSTVITGLEPGEYTVQAVETNVLLNNCGASPTFVTINDISTPPVVIDHSLSDNKHCAGAANGNGSIELNIDGVPTPGAGYSYVWHQGQLTTDPVLPAAQTVAGHTATDLVGGFYTVEVTNTTSTCSTVATFYINDDPYIINIIPPDISITNQDDCSPVNGDAIVTDIYVDGAAIGGTAGYTFDWYESDGVTLIVGAGNTASPAVALASGTYFVQATNTTANCQTSLVSFEVQNTSAPPLVVMVEDAPNTVCDIVTYTPNGQLSASVTEGGVPGFTAGYTFEWFIGQNSTTVPLPVGQVAGADGQIAQDLAPGYYTVRVTDNTTPNLGCITISTFEVRDIPDVISIANADITITNQNDCSPANGDALVTDVIVNSVATGGTAGFSFEWFQSDAVTLVAGAGAGDSPAVALAAGNYFVRATSTTSGCQTSLVPFEVLDVSEPPLVVMVEDAPNTVCDIVTYTPNGQLSASVTEGGVPGITAGYTFEWFIGQNSTTVPLPVGQVAGADGQIAQDLAPGYYTVRVTDNTNPNNNCVTISTFEVRDIPDVISIASADITITNQNDCSPANGDALVTDVIVNSVATGGTAGFSFEWFQSDAVTLVAGAGAGDSPAVALAAGNYFVRATSTTSGCQTSLVPFEVLDVSEPPLVVMVEDAPNTICDIVTYTPNGQLSASVTEGGVPGFTAGYTFEWFIGQNSTTVPLPVGQVAGADGQIAQDLAPGYYTVRVTDNTNPNNNCVTISTFEVRDIPDVISIANADITITNQNDCSPANGDALVTDVIVNSVATGGTAGFSFEWFQSDAVTLVAGAGAGDSPAVALAAGNYFVRATSTTSGCQTSLVPFEVLDVSEPPLVVMVEDAPNTICDIVTYTPNGQLSASVTEGGVPGFTAGYTFEWFIGQNSTTVPLPVGQVAGADGQIAQDLAPGYYTVRVTDNTNPNNNCVTISTFEVRDIDVISIASADITLTDKNDCSPDNGSAIVNFVTVNGIQRAPAGFSFQWFDATFAALPAPPVANIYNGLADGTYYVQATDNVSGCISPQVQFEIMDVSEPPVVVMVEDAPNTICDIVTYTPNGQLSASVTEGAVPGITAGYTFEWFIGQNSTTVPLPVGQVAGADGQIAQDLAPGYYTVRVTDNTNPNNNCVTISTFEVRDIPDIVIIASADITLTDKNDCSPDNGSAIVNFVTVNGIQRAPAGFSFQWFDATFAALPAPPVANIYNGLADGIYYVQATDNASGCMTPQVQFEIMDVSEPPVVVMVENASNTVCDIVSFTPDGQLSASVTEGGVPGVTAGYTFEWFIGQNSTTVPLPLGQVAGADGQIAQDLEPGYYTVRVTDNTNPNNNCFSIATMEVQDTPDMVNLNRADISVTDQSDCAPFNGSIAVNFVEVNGAQQAVGGFTFLWFDASLAALPAPPVPNMYTGLAAGTYYVQVTDNTTGCMSSQVEIEILDVTNLPVITLTSFTNPTQCGQPNISGELSVTADGSVNTTDYTFNWYQGNSVVTGTPIPGNNPTISGLTAGDYTVEVINNATGCISIDTYTLQTEVLPVVLSASASARTSCIAPDGSLFATVISGTSSRYTYNWYIGNQVKPAPDFVGSSVNGLDIGEYTVVAVDIDDPSCSSAPMTVTLIDARIFPNVQVVEEAPLTNCDPNRPNGVASATVNGSVIGYTFEWYLGSTVSGTPFFTGNQTGNLQATTYTVLVTDIVSGCSTTENITITEDLPVVDSPEIEILSHMTSCEAPNGSLSVSVNGNTQDYIFDWYTGQSVSGAPVYTGEIYSGLDVGFYTVTATSRQTGCVSAGTTAEIIEDLQYPDFYFEIGPSNCDEDNGFAKIFLNEEIDIEGIAWQTPNGIVYGPNLIDYPAGDYEVTITSVLGCTTTKTATIPPEIKVFNGISRNGDNLNDFFEVSCIESFPNNSVKIFNRAGTLVYEADGYNNNDILFDGYANRGVNLIGTNLPSGTYFYVIDKKDGSKPTSGYLELVND